MINTTGMFDLVIFESDSFPFCESVILKEHISLLTEPLQFGYQPIIQQIFSTKKSSCRNSEGEGD
jgi:hypothetical protein